MGLNRRTIVVDATTTVKNDVTKKLLLVRPPRCERPLEYYNHDGVALAAYTAAAGRARERLL